MLIYYINYIDQLSQNVFFTSQQVVHLSINKFDFSLWGFLELCSWFCSHFNQLLVTPTLLLNQMPPLYACVTVCPPSMVSSDGHSLEKPLLLLPCSSSLLLLPWILSFRPTNFLQPKAPLKQNVPQAQLITQRERFTDALSLLQNDPMVPT